MAGERYIYTEQKATPSKGGDGVASDDFSKNAKSSKGTRRLLEDHVDHASLRWHLFRFAQSSLKDHVDRDICINFCMVVDSCVVISTIICYCLTLLFNKG